MYSTGGEGMKHSYGHRMMGMTIYRHRNQDLGVGTLDVSACPTNVTADIQGFASTLLEPTDDACFRESALF